MDAETIDLEAVVPYYIYTRKILFNPVSITVLQGGLLEEEAVALLRSFYDRENFHAPDHKRKRKSAEEETK